MAIDDAVTVDIKPQESKLLRVGDTIDANYYVGAHEHITRKSKVVRVYRKDKYNMLLVGHKTKSKKIIYTCLKQLHTGTIWP